MFGMIIPDRKVPNFCTATLAPDCPAGAAVDALTGLPSRWHGRTLDSSASRSLGGVVFGRELERTVSRVTQRGTVVNKFTHEATETQHETTGPGVARRAREADRCIPRNVRTRSHSSWSNAAG
jgi:hypothetical protein